MKWSVIQDGLVHEIIEQDTKPEFAPYIFIVECPSEAAVGWSYSHENQTFTPPPEPPPPPPPPPAPLPSGLTIEQRKAVKVLLDDLLEDSTISDSFKKTLLLCREILGNKVV